VKFHSFGLTFIPGFMFGLEFPDFEDNDLTILVDLGIIRLIYEKWEEN